jgi:hypothetical protein
MHAPIPRMLYVQVDIACKEKVEEHNYATSYKFIVEQSKSSGLVHLFSIFGPRYRKLMYTASQFIFTLVAVHLAYLCYF